MIYYKNKDGTEHERRGQWIDNDLRGQVIHQFPAENKTIIEFWSAHWGKNGKFSLKIKLKLEWANFWSVLPLLHLMMYPKLNLEKS